MSQAPDLEKVKCSDYLKCLFSREEKEVFSSELAQQIAALDQLRIHKKQIVKSADSDIAEAETEIKKLATFVKDGYEFRMVDCECAYDYTLATKVITRLDTGEVVRKVAMTTVELQRTLPLEPKQEKETE
jgi:hypothetical protein